MFYDQIGAAWKRLLESRSFRHNLNDKLDRQRSLLEHRLALRRPKVALVKQDCNEDLYCCPAELSAWKTISSTLLRSGPVDLFTFFDTTFILLRTERDPECNIWREKSEALKWAPIEWFESFRLRIPGRDHGQTQYAQSADQVDWSAYDLVVSIDVSVPARISSRYPEVVWSYYVRELKAPSWSSSLQTPIAGQDLFLSQRFSPISVKQSSHVVDFPYHFQHVGTFHRLFPGVPPTPDAVPRKGIFVEYHSARDASDEQLDALSAFGPVYAYRSTNERFDERTGERIPDRTMHGRALHALMHSKYHVKWSGRSAFGTAKVEAIAAGCLCLSDPTIDGSSFLHSAASLVSDFGTLLKRLSAFESNDLLYQKELMLQRQRVDYLCCYRPANDLLDACERVMHSRHRSFL